MIVARKQYYPSIDGIRAIAVLAVILFHIELDLFSGGYVGVDIFFVISGYLISRNILLQLSNGDFHLLRFYSARFRRLIPALIATIALTLVFGVLLYSPDALIRLASSSVAGALSLANVRYWKVSGYFDIDSASKPLLHLWSLSVEEQFYFVWPVLLIITFKFFSNHTKSLSIVAIAGTISFCLAQYLVGVDSNTAFFWMPFRVYEFAIGAVLACHEMRREPGGLAPRLLSLVALLGLFLIVFSVTQFDEFTTFPGANSLYPCIGALMLIYARESKVMTLLLANYPMRFIGKISYSLYLVHWPIWVYLSFWYFREFDCVHKSGIFVLTMLTGSALHFLVERPFRYAKEGQGNIVFFTVLSLCAILIIAVAFHIRFNDGWPQRAPQIVAASNGVMDCHYPFGNKTVQDCSFGEKEPAKAQVLVLGDSHSRNLLQGLNEFGLDNNVSFRLYSVAGCAPLRDVKVFMKGSRRPVASCDAFSQKVTELISDARYDTVVFSARWMWYYEHEDYFEGQTHPNGFLLDGESRGKTAASSRKVWQKSLLSTVEFAQKRGKKVVLFSQYPLLNKRIGECDKSPSYLIDRDSVKLRCAVQIPYKQIAKRLQFTNEFIRNQGSASVLSILPSEYLCNDRRQSCNILTEGGLLYYDDNHLSAAGGRHLVNSITDELREFLLGQP